MKRGKPLKRTGFKSKPKRMKQVSDKRKDFWNSPEGKAELSYMGFVKEQDCCICGKAGPSEAHHCQSGRYGNRKPSGYNTIPLCPPCHKHEYGPGAYHYSKREWEAKHGPDHGYIKQTRELVRLMHSDT